MSIITFYSYKGGVGRSLAVANVAVQLAQAGKKVLVIDWDLEAPGLEEYFEEFKIDADGRGLLFLLRDRDSFDNHVWHLNSTTSGTALDFLPSGRDEEDYYPTLERFSQVDFFADAGGDYLEALRAEWNERYDHVLIDSRTGLSDAGGVCTIQLPDIVVGMFTATRQSYRGVRDVLELAQSSRQNLAYTRPQFSVIPVPCRVNTSDGVDVDRWMDEFAKAMDGLTGDWRPRGLPIRDVLWSLRVEHGRSLLHGTKIIDDEVPDAPAQALEAFRRIAGLIQSDLADLSGLKVESKSESEPEPEPQRTKSRGKWISVLRGTLGRKKTVVDSSISSSGEKVIPEDRDPPSVSIPPREKTGYDVYLQVPGGSIESRWVEEFFYDDFSDYLGLALGREPRIFFENRELSAGKSHQNSTQDALASSAALVAFISARYARSKYLRQEIEYFMALEGQRMVVPVSLSDARLPAQIRHIQAADFKEYFVTGSAEKYHETSDFWIPFSLAVKRLVDDLTHQPNSNPYF